MKIPVRTCLNQDLLQIVFLFGQVCLSVSVCLSAYSSYTVGLYAVFMHFNLHVVLYVHMCFLFGYISPL